MYAKIKLETLPGSRGETTSKARAVANKGYYHYRPAHLVFCYLSLLPRNAVHRVDIRAAESSIFGSQKQGPEKVHRPDCGAPSYSRYLFQSSGGDIPSRRTLASERKATQNPRSSLGSQICR
jgi:hypothetical protein